MQHTCGIAQYAGNVCSPSVERLPSLREKFMALVNSRNSRNRAGLVIEDFIRNMRRNAQAGHARNARPAQVVQSPPGHPSALIEQAFGSTEILKGLGMQQREDQRPALVRALQHRHRLIGEVHDVRLGVLTP
jgi:hypothetical protein